MGEIPQPSPDSEQSRERTQRFPTEEELRAFEDYRNERIGGEDGFYPNRNTTFESWFGYPDPRKPASPEDDQVEPSQQ